MKDTKAGQLFGLIIATLFTGRRREYAAKK